jgi:hypothetical protein
LEAVVTNRRLTGKQIEDRIKEAIAKAVSEVGGGNPSEMKKEAHAILTKPMHTQVEMLFAPLTAQIIYESWGKQIRHLKRRRCSDEELKLVLEQIQQELKGTLPMALRKGMDEIRKRLPRHGGPGRTNTLTQPQKIDACERIATAIKTKGASFPETFKAVAEMFSKEGISVSARTIRRVWENRKPLYA